MQDKLQNIVIQNITMYQCYC